MLENVLTPPILLEMAICQMGLGGRKRGNENSLPSPEPRELSGTRPLVADLVLVHLPTAQEYRLATGDTFIDQNFDLNPTVFGPALLGLIRCCCSVFAHRAGCHDMPHWHAALLD